MNAEINERWAQALESGKYKQTRGALRKRGNTFCCLGVLCDLAAQEGIVQMTHDESGYRYDYALTGLPVVVIEWAEMQNDNIDGYWDSDDYGDHNHNTLIYANDEEKRTFPEIAQIIRTHRDEL